MKIFREFLKRLCEGTSKLPDYFIDLSVEKWFEARLRIDWKEDKTLTIIWELPNKEEIGHLDVEHFTPGSTVRLEDLKVIGGIKMDN